MRRTAALSKSQGIILQTHLVFFHFSLSVLWLSNVLSRGRWLLKSGLVSEGLYVRTVVRYLASLSLRFIYPCNIGISFAAYCAVCTQVHYWIVSSSFSSWISIVCSKCFTSDHFRHFRHFGYTQRDNSSLKKKFQCWITKTRSICDDRYRLLGFEHYKCDVCATGICKAAANWTDLQLYR